MNTNALTPRTITARIAAAAALGCLLLAITPALATIEIDAAALEALIDGAKKSHTTSLVVLHNGKTVLEWHTDATSRKIETMSVTKSIVNIAIGRLMTTGKIKSIDEPVYMFYPEWKQGKKAAITLRHLLNHTSGLQNNETTQEIYQAPDFVQLALAAELTHTPGEAFSYNNKAVNLLAGIVQKISGQRMDNYLRAEIFTPLGINDVDWKLDKSGNPLGMSGLQIHARDLAKIGQLMLNDGVWNDEQLLSKEWIKQSTQPGSKLAPECGLLWWLVPDSIVFFVERASIERLRNAGGDANLIAQAEKLIGRYESLTEWADAQQRMMGDADALYKKLSALKIYSLARSEKGRIIGYRADGYLGQYVYVLPQSGLVAVRMIEKSSRYDQRTDRFDAFEKLVRALSK
jgi:CubicO group peptidase (beta-lactamase class C family)